MTVDVLSHHQYAVRMAELTIAIAMLGVLAPSQNARELVHAQVVQQN